MMRPGTVYWICGFSGAGKTTIASSLYKRLLRSGRRVVFLDGDILRAVFADKSSHTLSARKALGLQYARLARMLSDQGFDVVCATISLFSEVYTYNRRHIKRYYHVFLRCDRQELLRRDRKGIYSGALLGRVKNVVGIDLPYYLPRSCDLVIDNTSRGNIDKKVDKILRLKYRRKSVKKK